jgi:hypothetical protein
MNKKIVVSIFVANLIFAGSSLVSIGSAADLTVAEQYAPILYFVNDEKCFPVDVSYAIENSYLYEIGNPTPVSLQPTASLLSNYTSDSYYLDNQHGTVAVGDNGIENDYQSKISTLGFTVYVHVDTLNNVIQYWFFYAFNAGDLNRHEGDWEMIQVAFIGSQPSHVMFSQHYSGQTATWSQVDKEGDHVKVYVAKGSHANYIKPFSGKIGLASDTVADNGRILRPSEFTIKNLDDQAWLNFGGRWGWVGTSDSGAAESEILGEAGPNGPKYREDGLMWQSQAWAAGLSPASDSLFLLEWLVYNFVMLYILFTVLSLGLFSYFIYRRKKKYGLGPRIFSLLYIDGVNQKSIGNILCVFAIIIALLGVILPWYTVTADVSVPSYPETGTFNALTVDSLNGIQIRLPNQSGPVPLGTFVIPFYLIVGISLLFLVVSTVGISQSKKLGKKYLLKGIRLFLPFLLILIFIMAVASIIPMVAPDSIKGDTEVFTAMQAISAAPFNGEYTIQQIGTEQGSVHLQWGFGVGAYLLLFAGILLFMAGLMEITSPVDFFEIKSPADVKVEPKTDEQEKRNTPAEKK